MDEEEIRRRLEIVVAAQSAAFDKAAQYDNSLVGLGFVAFFALWAGVNADIPRWGALATVALIALSMTCYISWNIINMLGRHIGNAELQKMLGESSVMDSDFADRWNAASMASIRTTSRLMNLWKPVFGASIITGLPGALLLSGLAATSAYAKLERSASQSTARHGVGTNSPMTASANQREPIKH